MLACPYLFLSKGETLSGEQIVSAAFFNDMLTPRSELREAWKKGDYADLFPNGHYRNQTYVVNADCTHLAMLGIHDQFCFVDIEKELLVVGYGSYPTQVGPVLVTALLTFWENLLNYYSH